MRPIDADEALEYFVTNMNWMDEDGYPIINSNEKRSIFKEFFDGVPTIADGLSVHRTGKWDADLEVNHEIDNRGADPINITDENARYYKDKQGNESIHCPHCGCTLDRFVCMPHHFCYVCGGKFGEIDLSADKDNSEEDGDNVEA